MHHDDLLDRECQRPENHVLPFPPYVLQILDRRKVMLDLPEHVWEKKSDSDGAGNPDPRLEKLAAKWRQEERCKNREAEEDRRVLVFQTESRKNTEPQPQPGIACAQKARHHEHT